MYFKIMSKVVKYTCRLRDIITHMISWILTIYISISCILKNIFEGGGAKFNFAPGRQLPSLRHCYYTSKDIITKVSFSSENNVSLYVQFSNYSRPILAFITIRVKIKVWPKWTSVVHVGQKIINCICTWRRRHICMYNNEMPPQG